jgi:hypothetical protein
VNELEINLKDAQQCDKVDSLERITKKMNRKELRSTLEERVMLDTAPEYDQLLNKVLDIFERLPDQDARKLIASDVQFVMPITNATVKQRMVYTKGAEEKVYWLILLRTDFLEESKDVIIYTLAHELAHVFLGHEADVPNPEAAMERELATDRQVVKWGFEKELRGTPHNYLYGNGSVQQ